MLDLQAAVHASPAALEGAEKSQRRDLRSRTEIPDGGAYIVSHAFNAPVDTSDLPHFGSRLCFEACEAGTASAI